MKDPFKKISDVKRLDNRNLMFDMRDRLLEYKDEAKAKSKDAVFKTKFKGQLEAIEEVLNWLHKYEQETRSDIDKVKEFLRTLFPDYFEDIVVLASEREYSNIISYVAMFYVPSHDKFGDKICEEDITDTKQDIIKAIQGINEAAFPDAAYILVASVRYPYRTSL